MLTNVFKLGLFAHPGHGSSDVNSVWHYIFEPEHLIYWVILGILGTLVWRFVHRNEDAN